MELKTNNMKKGPFKLKYKNSAFPFNESSRRLQGLGIYSAEFGDALAKSRLEKGQVKMDRGHTHTSDYIIDPEQVGSGMATGTSIPKGYGARDIT